MKECEELERKATSFKNKFKRGLSEARALEAECLDLDEKRNDIKLQFCMYEPFLKRFGVTKDNLKCKGGSSNSCSYIVVHSDIFKLCVQLANYG